MFGKLDLQGIEEWSEYDQNQVCELIKEYQHLFVLDDLELGSTSQIKHKIKLSDPNLSRIATGEFHHNNLRRSEPIYKICSK